MSISTKRGDNGTTDLMFGRRVPKTDLRVEACGAIDELNAAMGIVRVTATRTKVRLALQTIQLDLIVVMGELMTLEEDRERYFEKGFKSTTREMVEALTGLVNQFEADAKKEFDDWSIPGETASLASAQLELCRTVCRRAERAIAVVAERDLLTNEEIQCYINRLSDFFWLLARAEEAK